MLILCRVVICVYICVSNLAFILVEIKFRFFSYFYFLKFLFLYIYKIFETFHKQNENRLLENIEFALLFIDLSWICECIRPNNYIYIRAHTHTQAHSNDDE
jgi:hypothetical protein